MKFALSIVVISLSLLCRAESPADQIDVRVGDSALAARNHLGEPKIEFPLRGQLVQDYGYCVITSSNGVVTSVKVRESSPAKKGKAKPADLATVKGLLAQAKTGDAEAQYCLAYCYQTGEAVEKNMVEAIRWYTLSAMQGHMAAQHNLGVIYMTGESVTRDYEQAYTWALLAAENGNDQLLRTLKNHVSIAQQKAGALRAQRIRDGLEEIPYDVLDSSTTVATKDAGDDNSAAD